MLLTLLNRLKGVKCIIESLFLCASFRIYLDSSLLGLALPVLQAHRGFGGNA